MRLNILKISAAALIAVSAIGCNNAEYQPVGNRMYMAEAATGTVSKQQIERLTVKGDMTADIHARLAQPADKDINVTFGIDLEFLAEYNAKYGTDYQVLPDEFLTFPENAVIPAGQTTSSAATIGIKAYTTPNGESYCIPIRITGNDGGYELTEESSHLIYLLSAPLMQVVPGMTSPTLPVGDGSWDVSTPEWTLEGWVWMRSFPLNNQSIWDPVSSPEIYIRFGDADIPYDVLQIKVAGSQFESKTAFTPEQWYHIAFTFDTEGKCTLYVNGEEDASMTFSKNTFNITDMSMCTSHVGFQTTAKMAQVRFWKKALSGSVIKSSMNGEVPSDSDGLFGYWKLNEGTGNIFHDSTSNGYDMTCAVAPAWSTDRVDFSDPNSTNQ